MHPFFSIIVPTYNRALLISRAIESVIAQSFGDWELVIVDDGSKDNTKEVVSKYTDPRIRYIYQANAERCAARNNGIEHANGQYICFLDSDDYYLTNRLELLHKKLTAMGFPIGMFYTGLAIDDGASVINRTENAYAGNNIFDKIALSIIHSQQVCVHRQVLEKNRYDIRFHIGEDMELWLRIVEKYPITYLEGQFTIITVDHEERSVNVKKYNSYIHQLRLFNYIFVAPHPGHNISPEVKKRLLGNCYFGIAKYNIYNGMRYAATINVVRSIFSDLASYQLKFRINVLRMLLTFSSFNKIQPLIEY